MEVDIEAQKSLTDELPNILTAMTRHDWLKKCITHWICVPNDNSARSYVMLPDAFPLSYMHSLFFLHNMKTAAISRAVMKNIHQSSSCSPKQSSFPLLSFLSDSLCPDEANGPRKTN